MPGSMTPSPETLRAIEAGMEGAREAGRELARLAKRGASEQEVAEYFARHGSPLRRGRVIRRETSEISEDRRAAQKEITSLSDDDFELVQQLLELLRSRRQS